MYDLDRRLNGKLSDQHRQDVMRQVQYERFAQEVKAAQSNHKAAVPVRTMLIAVINLLVR